MSLPWEEQTRTAPVRLSLLTNIMSSETPFKTNRIRKIAGSFKVKLSSLLHLSRAPTPSSIEMDPSSDYPTRRATESFTPTFHWNSLVFLRISPLNVVPVVGVDHAPTTAFATEVFSGSPISASVPKQLSSASGRVLETLPTVSDQPALTIIVANYWSFSICLLSAVVNYRPLHLIPSCRQSRN